MQTPSYKTALIVGAGEGLSASLARLLSREKIRVALAARKIDADRLPVEAGAIQVQRHLEGIPGSADAVELVMSHGKIPSPAACLMPARGQ